MNGINSSLDQLVQFLDVASLRHKVIANNVANVNTPGFRALRVSFEEEFRQRLEGLGEEGILPTSPRVEEAPGGTLREDDNNVDIDRELGSLTKNTLLYQAIAQVLSTRLSEMRTAITGR